MVSLPCSFVQDRRGIAAVEFALILPILVTLFLGIVEVSNLLSADSKMRAVSASVSDLVTQDADGLVSAGDIAIYNLAAVNIMSPIPVNNRLVVTITTYSVDASANATVSWRRQLAPPAAPTETIAGACSGAGLPMPLRSTSTLNDVVRVDTSYVWTPMFLPGWTNKTLRSTNFNMPRYSLRLSLDTGLPTGC